MSYKFKSGDPAPKPLNPMTEAEIMSTWVDKDDIKVSICCITYNHEPYIRDALHGFLAQNTDFAFEVLIHDDASTDKTADIIREYERDYPHIVKPIYQTENQYSKGVKVGIYNLNRVRGAYIALCEGDDYWVDREKLKRQYDFLEKNKEYSVCGSDACIIKDGKIFKSSKLPINRKKSLISKQLQKGSFVLTLTAMYRNCVGNVSEEQTKVLNGDAFMFTRLGEYGGYAYMKNIIPSVYRVHSGGIWSELDNNSKNASSLNTRFWIMKYFKRNKNTELENYYAYKCIAKVLEIQDIKFKYVIKVFLMLSKMYVFQFFRKNKNNS